MAQCLKAGALEAEVPVWKLSWATCGCDCAAGGSSSAGMVLLSGGAAAPRSKPRSPSGGFWLCGTCSLLFVSALGKFYFKWPVPGRRLSTWIQVFPLSQPSLHLHVLTPPAASLVSCAIFFSSLGFSRLFACCVF